MRRHIFVRPGVTRTVMSVYGSRSQSCGAGIHASFANAARAVSHSVIHLLAEMKSFTASFLSSTGIQRGAGITTSLSERSWHFSPKAVYSKLAQAREYFLNISGHNGKGLPLKRPILPEHYS